MISAFIGPCPKGLNAPSTRAVSFGMPISSRVYWDPHPRFPDFPTSRFGNGSEHYVQQLQRKWFLGRLGILHSIRVPVSIVRIELPFFIFYFLFSFAACCNGDVAPLLHCNE